MAYSVMIDESQRAFLAACVRAATSGDVPLVALPEGDPDDLGYLLPMLDQLPEDEAASPGCLHGFCL